MSDTPSRYFGYKTVQGGKVRLLASETFRDLVQSQIHVPVAFPMKRRDFLAHPDRDKLKDGAWLGAATYAEDECQRKDSAAVGFNLIIIDLDGGPEAADFAQSPDTIREALSPYNFVAWTTAKHTPAEPRIKIMVDCLTAEPSLFKRAVMHVIGLLGLPASFKGKPESLIISQPQYRPLHFQGEDYNAVLADRLDGKRLDATTLPETTESPDDGGYAYAPEAGDMKEGSILNLPLTGMSLDDIREPLFTIDADCGYRPWYEIAAALRHQFTEEDEAREAFEMFHEWSSQGAKYKDRDECLLKWRSFKPYPEGRNPITLRTLFHHAMQSGWTHEKLTTKVVETFSQWCEATDGDTVLREGIRKIAALPIPSDTDEEMMADMIVKAVKRSGKSVSKTSILKDMKRLRRQEKHDGAKAEKPSWMLPFCFIGPRDRFRNTVTGAEYAVDAFNHTFGRNLVTPDGDVPISASHYALYTAGIKIVDDSVYDPREAFDGDKDKEKKGDDIYFERDGKWFVNTYLKSSVPQASPIGAERAGNLILALLRANLADENHVRYILDWLAYCVQRPGHKIRWSPFLQGGQGCGKGTLMDTVQAAIGEANFRIITGSKMTGSGFDEWREGVHLNYIDELFSAGSNRHEVNNSLKDAIANDRIPVQQKFRDLRNIVNVTNYFVTSNKHDALVLEDSDRRYMILKSRLQSKSQVVAFLNTGVCTRIHELIRDNPGAFRQFYLTYPISETFNPNGHAPDTVFRHELVDAGKNPMLIQIEDLIADPAYPLIGKDVIHYAQVERETALLGRNNARASHYLHILGYRAYENAKVFEVGGERTRVYVSIENFMEGVDDPVELLEERMPEL